MNEDRYRAAERQFWGHYGASPTERWLDLRRPATRVRIQELGEGPALLFLHGGPAAGTIFAPLASHLTDFHCIVLDRPGCGLSPPIPYRQARLDETMADAVESCLDALGINRVQVVASSFGGACALWFARSHPDRVDRVVFMGCPAFVSQMRVSPMLRLLSSPGAGYLAARLPMNRTGTFAFMRSMGQQRLIEEDGLPEPFVEWWISLGNDTGTMRSERELIRRGITPVQGMRPELVLEDGAVQTLDLPAYVYWGADDPFAPITFGVPLVERMINGAIDVIPGAGHLPWFDNGVDAADRTRAFLTGAQRPSPMAAA